MISDSPTNLILAAAGRGNTRTLTYRVARLMEKGASPGNILLLTFTNKAAQKMLQRVETLTGFTNNVFDGGTFHHICQRLLRRHLENPSFAILNEDDSLALFDDAIKFIFPDFANNNNKSNPRALYEIVSFSCNTTRTVANAIEEKYAHMAKHDDALDYDDLLANFVQLLEKNPDSAR